LISNSKFNWMQPKIAVDLSDEEDFNYMNVKKFFWRRINKLTKYSGRIFQIFWRLGIEKG
jgi:hypothetical protein